PADPQRGSLYAGANPKIVHVAGFRAAARRLASRSDLFGAGQSLSFQSHKAGPGSHLAGRSRGLVRHDLLLQPPAEPPHYAIRLLSPAAVALGGKIARCFPANDYRLRRS